MIRGSLAGINIGMDARKRDSCFPDTRQPNEINATILSNGVRPCGTFTGVDIVKRSRQEDPKPDEDLVEGVSCGALAPCIMATDCTGSDIADSQINVPEENGRPARQRVVHLGVELLLRMQWLRGVTRRPGFGGSRLIWQALFDLAARI